MNLVAFSLFQELELLGVGALAGVLGGLFGIGGGIVMIPAMVIFLGDAYGQDSFHVYKLAAISTSIVLSLPAAVRHARAGAVVYRALPGILPLTVVGVVAGVLLASLMVGEHTAVLRRVFGVFLELTVAFEIYQNWRAARGETYFRTSSPMPTRRVVYGLVVGFPAGFVGGLLGVGGGIWAVPAQRQLLGIRIRNAIANSTVMVVGIALVTAVLLSYAVARLPEPINPWKGWWLALWLAPGALVGGWCGADLTHRLPVRWLRYGFQTMLALTGLRLILG